MSVLKIKNANNEWESVPVINGEDAVSPTITTSKVGRETTLTITDVNGTHTATILDGVDGTGSGDMTKSVYDTNNNGIVDNAEKVNNHTVQSDVPANAVFTDTTYTAGTGIAISNGVISNTQSSAAWGNITGTLSSQTDLQTALNNIEDGIENVDQEVEDISQSLGVDTNTYDNTATYSVGNKVIYKNKIYECNTAISTAEDFDSSKWDLVPVIDNMKINNKLLSSTIVDTTNTNLNDYKTSGTYYFGASYAPINRPTGSNGWLEVFTGEQGGEIAIKQIWYRHGTPNSNDRDTYVRTYSSGVWSDWKKYVDTNSLNIQRLNVNSNTFTIRIPHDGGSNINSAIVLCHTCCYVVAIGSANQLWTYLLGNRNNVTMTPTIVTHTDSYVDVNLTFSETVWGGISVIGVGNYV